MRLDYDQLDAYVYSIAPTNATLQLIIRILCYEGHHSKQEWFCKTTKQLAKETQIPVRTVEKAHIIMAIIISNQIISETDKI